MPFTPIPAIGTIDLLVDKPETGDTDDFVTKTESAYTKLQNYMNSVAASIDSINVAGAEVDNTLADAQNLAAVVNIQSTNLQAQLDAYNAINGIVGTDLAQLGADIDALVAASGGVVATTGNQNIGGVKTFTSTAKFGGGIEVDSFLADDKPINFNMDGVLEARVEYNSLGGYLNVGHLNGAGWGANIEFYRGGLMVANGDLRRSTATVGGDNALTLTTKGYVDAAVSGAASTFTGGTIANDFTISRVGENATLTVESDTANAYLVLDGVGGGSTLVEFKNEGEREALVYNDHVNGIFRLRKYNAAGQIAAELRMLDNGTIDTDGGKMKVGQTAAGDSDDTVATKKYVDDNGGGVWDFVHESGIYSVDASEWVTGHFDGYGSNNTIWSDSAGSGATPVINDQWKLIGIPLFKGDVVDSVFWQTRCNSNNVDEIEYQIRFIHANPTSLYSSGVFGNAQTTAIDVQNDNLYNHSTLADWTGLSGRLYRRTMPIGYTAPEDGMLILFVRPTMINGQASDSLNTRLIWKINRTGTPEY